jgi:hypothetical protein
MLVPHLFAGGVGVRVGFGCGRSVKPCSRVPVAGTVPVDGLFCAWLACCSTSCALA